MGMHDRIIEFEWSGKTRYRCPLCYFDTSNKVDIKIHINATHLADIQPRVPEAELYNAAGKQVEYMPSPAGHEELLDTATVATERRK